MANAKRDENRIPTLIGVSSADGSTPVPVKVDPVTNRMLVSAATAALDDISDVVITSGAQGDILYNDGTNWVNLAPGTSGHYLKTQGAAANPTWAAVTASPGGADTQVQFNDGGSLNGEAGFVYNKTTDTATLAGDLKADRVGMEDSDSSHYLYLDPGSNLTGDHVLTVTTGDADRTITISGNATVSQDYSTTGNPQFATIELGHATDTTLSRSSAGVLAVEGVTVPLNSITSTHTASTIELGHASDTTLSRSSAGILAVEGVTVSMNSTSATHTAGTVELGNASDTTLSRSAAGVLAVEGVDVATISGTQTLTNKTINLTSNTLTGTTAQFNTALSDGDFATLAGSETLSNKTLTAPKFASAGLVADANGNELILFPSTVASAVNEMTISNAATGNPPSIAATGGDTNISLNLDSKGTGTINPQHAVVEKVVTLTDAATIATDASLGNVFTVTLGDNRTLGAPTNPTNGQKIIYRIRQDGTGSRTLSYNAVFRFGTDVTSPTLSTAAGKTDYLGFIYNSTDSKWDCVAVAKGY